MGGRGFLSWCSPITPWSFSLHQGEQAIYVVFDSEYLKESSMSQVKLTFLMPALKGLTVKTVKPLRSFATVRIAQEINSTTRNLVDSKNKLLFLGELRSSSANKGKGNN